MDVLDLRGRRGGRSQEYQRLRKTGGVKDRVGSRRGERYEATLGC